MSEAVPVEALQHRIAEFGSGAFLITVNAEMLGHVVSVAPRVEDGCLMLAVGHTTRANLATNPSVTLLWPRSPDGAYGLIVDGLATKESVDDREVAVTPTRAVLHRLVDPIGDGPGCLPVEQPSGSVLQSESSSS